MAEPRPGDLLAIMSAGAYGAVQAGTYNSRLLVPEVLVDGDKQRGDPPARRLRRLDRTRHNSDVVDINPFFGAKLTFRERGGGA